MQPELWYNPERMEKKIRLAFDLDGVIIGKPPFISKKLLERLFRGGGKNGLRYRFPHSKLEQVVRKLSHFYLFRPPIRENIEFIKELANNPQYELYIVSGRYSFLEKETDSWLRKRKIESLFVKVFLNNEDKEPHLYKEEVLRKLQPAIFIDDDGVLADYLVEKKLPVKIFCFNQDLRCKFAKSINRIEKILQ